MKIVLVLLDGLGDRSHPVIGNKTPLQAATTPNMDRLAEIGATGLYHAGLLGQCLPSEVAHYFLFGYHMSEYPGRGLLEAVGYDVQFDDNDVLALAHLSGVAPHDRKLILTHKASSFEADRKRIAQLYRDISSYESGGIHFTLVQTRLNNAILVMKGKASPYISDSDPMTLGRPMAMIRPLIDNPEPEPSSRTANALNSYLDYCRRVLTEHGVNRERQRENLPVANFLATQRCGRRRAAEPFASRWGMNGAVIASGAVYKGIARELGMGFIKVKDTSNPAEDLRERVRLAMNDNSHDFLHVHTKVPDEAAHKTDPTSKMSAISELDKGLDELVAAVERRDNLLAIVAADHSTPCSSQLIHSGEPVPVVMAGPVIRRDEVARFDEVACAAGCLGVLRGKELLLMALNFAERSALTTHRLSPRETWYFPDDYEAFEEGKE